MSGATSSGSPPTMKSLTDSGWPANHSASRDATRAIDTSPSRSTTEASFAIPASDTSIDQWTVCSLAIADHARGPGGVTLPHVTRRRWRQVGWAGVALAGVSVAALLVSPWCSVGVLFAIRDVPEGFGNLRTRTGGGLSATRGGLIVRWRWWTGGPWPRLDAYAFRVEGPDHLGLAFYRHCTADEAIIGLPYLAAVGVMLCIVGRLRGREPRGLGFEVQPVEGTT